MRFTVALITLFSISASWAVKVKNMEDPKDKREAPVGYPSSSHGHSYQTASLGHGASYQAPSVGHGDASAISVGAGYSVGGGKPSFSYGAPESGQGYQLSSDDQHSGGHATIQLAPITLQPSQGHFASNDLAQLMSQLSYGLDTGSLQLSPHQPALQSAHGGQEYSLPQFTFGGPKFQEYSAAEQHISSVPSYAAGTKGLGSYGSTGPVLFNPSDSHSSQAALAYSAPSSGHSFGDGSGLSLGSGHSFAGLSLGDSGHSLGNSGYSLGGSGHSLGGAGLSLGGSGHSFGGSGHSFGGSGHALGGSGHALGGSGHSLGGSGHSLGGSFKSLGASYVVPSKSSFKPSAYIGGDSSHGLSSLSGSYSAPSFGSHSLSGHGHGLSLSSGGHGPSFGGSFGGGSVKFLAPSYAPHKSEGFGSSLDSAAAFASHGHISSPPGTTYGTPAASYGLHSNNAHSASSHTPQYYVMSSKHASPSFGEGSSSHRAPSSHGSVSSFSSGPKYSFGGHSSHSSPNSRYGSPKDSHGAHSETLYNTIKYSTDLKPRVH